MDRQQFLQGEMPTFMREAHALVSLQFDWDEDTRDEAAKEKEMHDFMDSLTDPHGVLMYLASYVTGDFTKEEWQQKLLEVERAFRGSVA